MTLKELIESDTLLEIGRRAVEDALVVFRNARMSQPLRGNGLVIREKDGSESSVIRLGVEQALKIALQAIIDKENA